MLRKFVSLHGTNLLKTCLEAHIESKTIVRHQILLCLKSLPIANRATVVKIEDLVKRMEDVEVFGEETARLANELLESWSQLQMLYKIPKRSFNELESTPAVKPAAPAYKSYTPVPVQVNQSSGDVERDSIFNNFTKREWRSQSQLGDSRTLPRKDRRFDDFMNHSPASSWTGTPKSSLIDVKPMIAPTLLPGVSNDALSAVVEAAAEDARKRKEQAELELKRQKEEKKEKEKEKKEREKEKPRHEPTPKKLKAESDFSHWTKEQTSHVKTQV